jgi:rod shape-determining protein MreB
MVSSDSHEEEELTVIGTPKDLIAKNFLKRDVLFGEQALKNRLALNLFRPLEHGVIKDTPEDRDFIAHFITHLINLSDPEEYDRVVAVIGAPAEASYVDKTAIFDAAAGTVNAAMIISEPFAVAYALDMIEQLTCVESTELFQVLMTKCTQNMQAITSIEKLSKRFNPSIVVLKSPKTWHADGRRTTPLLEHRLLMNL